MFLATTRSGLSGVIFRQWPDIECSALELKRYPVTRYFRRAKLLVFKTSKAPLTFLNAIAILGVWGPTLSAIIVTAMFYGKDGLKRFFARVNAREGLKWFLPLPGFFLLIGLAGRFIGSAATGIDFDPRFWGWAWVVQVMLVQLLIAGMGEEFG